MDASSARAAALTLLTDDFEEPKLEAVCSSCRLTNTRPAAGRTFMTKVSCVRSRRGPWLSHQMLRPHALNDHSEHSSFVDRTR